MDESPPMSKALVRYRRGGGGHSRGCRTSTPPPPALTPPRQPHRSQTSTIMPSSPKSTRDDFRDAYTDAILPGGTIKSTSEIEEELRNLTIVGDHPSLSLTFCSQYGSSEDEDEDEDEQEGEKDEEVNTPSPKRHSDEYSASPTSSIEEEEEDEEEEEPDKHTEIEKQIKRLKETGEIIRFYTTEKILRNRTVDTKMEACSEIQRLRQSLLTDMQSKIDYTREHEHDDDDSIIVEYEEEDTEEMIYYEPEHAKRPSYGSEKLPYRPSHEAKNKKWKSFGDHNQPTMERKKSHGNIRRFSKGRKGSLESNFEIGDGVITPPSTTGKKKSFGDVSLPFSKSRKNSLENNSPTTSFTSEGEVFTPPLSKKKSFGDIALPFSKSRRNSLENNSPATSFGSDEGIPTPPLSGKKSFRDISRPGLTKKKSFVDLAAIKSPRDRSASFGDIDSPTPALRGRAKSFGDGQVVRPAMRKKRSFKDLASLRKMSSFNEENLPPVPPLPLLLLEKGE